ncbi:ATP-binding protein [Saccharopolyspora elongata]|uniref:ATP-binding protein n=1 Tax=Saccharopolyspora elongata TaxID=2530387 RepID=UPI001404D5AC|nr:tetratricopeptide repeat protein [Saccharopolyspora elongata]
MHTTPEPDEYDPHKHAATHSELSGRAADVVQARDVSGGVHFHHPPAAEHRADVPVPRQLPPDVWDFVNRDAELQRLDLKLLRHESSARVSALCVIVGTAGVGKTAFALHWAHKVQHEFPDGQLYVNLRGYDPGSPVTPHQALERFLRALDVPASAIPRELEDRATLFRSRLAGRRILVVLDNASGPGQVRPLLPGTSDCLVLVTSRSRLSGLVARDGAYRLTLNLLDEAEATTLLRKASADYRSTDSATDLAELSRLCARLPLALRIAAERAASQPTIPLRELIARLRDESELWDALTASHDDESDAVRSVFAWSYRGLTAGAHRLFRLLGLHPGPEFSTHAAAALVEATVGEARRLLDELVGTHLLEQIARDRYQFHDLLRAYALDEARHEDPDTAGAALRRLLLWYLRTADACMATAVPGAFRTSLAEQAEGSPPMSFDDQTEAITWFDQERSNLLAAAQAAHSAGMPDLAWQIPAAIQRMYARYNHFDDWRTACTIALPAVREVGDRSGEAVIIESLAKLHTQSFELDQGIEFHQAALALRQGIGDRIGQVSSLNGIALAALRGHRLDQAHDYFERAHSMAMELDDHAWQAITANGLAHVHLEAEDYKQAHELNRIALTLYREVGNEAGEGDALRCASEIQRRTGHLEQAYESIDRALGIAEEARNPVWEGWWLLDLGRLQVALGQAEDALETYHRAAALQRRIGDRSREGIVWDAIGQAYAALDRYPEATEFHRTAAERHRQLGDRWNLALTLTHLAHALTATGARAEASTHANEAQQILAEFTDPAARRLHNQVSALSAE